MARLEMRCGECAHGVASKAARREEQSGEQATLFGYVSV